MSADVDISQPDKSIPDDKGSEREAAERFIEARHAKGESVGGLCLKRGTGPDRCMNPASRGSVFCVSCEALSRKDVSEAIRGSPGSPDWPPKIQIPALSYLDVESAPDPDIEWLVDRMLLASGTSVMAGSPKAGKSTLARRLAVAVACGRPWLGRKVAKGRALVLSLEDSLWQVRRDLSRPGVWLPEYSDSEKSNLMFAFRDGIPPEAAHRTGALDELVSRVEPSLVIVDTVIRLTRFDVNDYGAAAEHVGPFAELAARRNCHVCLSHHNRKSGGPGVDAVLGSAGIAGAVDCILSATWDANTKRRTLYAYGRDDVDIGPLNLAMEDGWISVGGSERERTLGDSVAEWLAENPESTSKQVQAGVKANRKAVLRVLEGFGRENRAQCSGSGVKGDPVRWSLA